MITQNTDNLRKDAYLLGNTLLRLALPRVLIRVTVVLTLLAILLYCVQTILNRGKSWLEFALHVSGLTDILGKTVVDFMVQYQKYFWWALALILVLITLSFISSWLKGSLKRGRAALVPLSETRKLCAGLSPEALDVLNWVWKDQTTPITVGNLQATLSQLRSGRIRKIALAREQKAALEQALQPQKAPASPGIPTNKDGQREPTLLA
ncbi:MAG: hypothetical protein RLZZ192_484 [Pseudomonadota bacterium]